MASVLQLAHEHQTRLQRSTDAIAGAGEDSSAAKTGRPAESKEARRQIKIGLKRGLCQVMLPQTLASLQPIHCARVHKKLHCKKAQHITHSLQHR